MKKCLYGFAFCVLAILAVTDVALAEDAVAAAGNGGLLGIGAGLGMGLAALGGALGMSKIISAALEGISRNPAADGKMFLPWVLGLVFVEVAVVLTFVINLGLSGKI